MEYKLPPLPEHPEPRIMKWSELEKRTIQEYGEACAIAAIEAQGVPDGYELVDKGALQMVINVLQRDAANGMQVRGEIVEKLLASAPPAPQASVVQQEPIAWSTGIKWNPVSNYQSEQVQKLTRESQPEYGFTVPLYTHPAQQVKPQPLSRAQINGLCESAGYDLASERERSDFINGIRHSEAAHGIQGS